MTFSDRPENEYLIGYLKAIEDAIESSTKKTGIPAYILYIYDRIHSMHYSKKEVIKTIEYYDVTPEDVNVRYSNTLKLK